MFYSKPKAHPNIEFTFHIEQNKIKLHTVQERPFQSKVTKGKYIPGYKIRKKAWVKYLFQM